MRWSLNCPRWLAAAVAMTGSVVVLIRTILLWLAFRIFFRRREKGEETVYMRREDKKLLEKILEKERAAAEGKE